MQKESVMKLLGTISFVKWKLNIPVKYRKKYIVCKITTDVKSYSLKIMAALLYYCSKAFLRGKNDCLWKHLKLYSIGLGPYKINLYK